LAINASDVAEYGNAPNPVTFVLILQTLATIVENYSQLAFGSTPVTQYGHFAKLRNIHQQLTEWERTVPAFLDWRQPTKDRTPRRWMTLQRVYLESQYQCLNMKISCSIATLEPVLMAKFQPGWDNGDPYAEARISARRVIDIVQESAAATKGCSLYHSDAVRATATLLQIMLAVGAQQSKGSMQELIAACRGGIALCRSLVPVVLSKAEDTIEKILDGHIQRWENGSLPHRDPPPTYVPYISTPANGNLLETGFKDDQYPLLFFDGAPLDHLFNEEFQAGLPFHDSTFHFGLLDNIPSNLPD